MRKALAALVVEGHANIRIALTAHVLMQALGELVQVGECVQVHLRDVRRPWVGARGMPKELPGFAAVHVLTTVQEQRVRACNSPAPGATKDKGHVDCAALLVATWKRAHTRLGHPRVLVNLVHSCRCPFPREDAKHQAHICWEPGCAGRPPLPRQLLLPHLPHQRGIRQASMFTVFSSPGRTVVHRTLPREARLFGFSLGFLLFQLQCSHCSQGCVT
mmetsp:Transcript_24138/g.56202  ORF Transcript_24138/g.56202 Transcript_24138/m.56202 type:complete len:217 (-) Transcript_24138:90-740(-)